MAMLNGERAKTLAMLDTKSRPFATAIARKTLAAQDDTDDGECFCKLLLSSVK